MLSFPYQDEPLTGPTPPSLPPGTTVRWRPLVPVRLLGPTGKSRNFSRAVFDPCADDTVFPADSGAVAGHCLAAVHRAHGPLARAKLPTPLRGCGVGTNG